LAERIIKTFSEDAEVQILNGRWGPYIAYKGRNLKIPKGTEPSSFTFDAIVELAANTPESTGKGRFGRFAKKSATSNEAPLKKAASKKPVAKKAPAKKAVAKEKPVAAKTPAKKVAKKSPAKKAAKKK